MINNITRTLQMDLRQRRALGNSIRSGGGAAIGGTSGEDGGVSVGRLSDPEVNEKLRGFRGQGTRSRDVSTSKSLIDWRLSRPRRRCACQTRTQSPGA